MFGLLYLYFPQEYQCAQEPRVAVLPPGLAGLFWKSQAVGSQQYDDPPQ